MIIGKCNICNEDIDHPDDVQNALWHIGGACYLNVNKMKKLQDAYEVLKYACKQIKYSKDAEGGELKDIANTALSKAEALSRGIVRINK